MAMADDKTLAHQTKQTLIFTYGTLKHGFPNYHLIQGLINQNDAAFIGSFITHHSYPLVIGPNGIPYLINLLGEGGHRVKGELYSVSTRGLAQVDELEGTSSGHYERLPIEVIQVGSQGDENGAVLVDAEAYFAHRSFGEKMWERRGRVGLSEYSERDVKDYVKKEDRAQGSSFLDDIALFLSNS